MRVLLVDDDPLNVELFRDTLEAVGHDVAVEADGALGRDHALREEFDLVLLDVLLPGISGLEVCRELRAAKYSGPIVALSALALPDQIAAGLAAGLDAYLTKPIEPADLREAVAKYGSKPKS